MAGIAQVFQHVGADDVVILLPRKNLGKLRLLKIGHL